MRKKEPAGAYPSGTYPGRARRAAPAGCPLAAAFAAVGGKWKPTIRDWRSRDEHHFSALMRRVAPISHTVLAEQLRELEAEGLVLREATAPVPAPVRYRLSAYGETVLPLVEAARAWGATHLQRGTDAAASTCAMAAGLPIGTGYAVASAAR
ncbi:MAG: winged helix-turn-helix transcriptional regulator [Luteimonas sp.]